MRWTVILAVIAALAMGACSTSSSPPYNGIDTDKYLTLTCGEWLAASEVEQMGWAEFDQDVSLQRAASDIAEENIKSFSVEEWADGIRDACVEQDPSSLVFPPL